VDNLTEGLSVIGESHTVSVFRQTRIAVT